MPSTMRSLAVVLAVALACLACLACLASPSHAAVLRVKYDAPGPTRNGATWDTAFVAIQAAIDAARSGDEIWVAEGVYVKTLTVKAGISLYGGYAGTETARTQRDLEAHRSIIEPDGSAGVEFSYSAGSSTIFDGFVVRKGWTGIDCSYASPTVRNNVVMECLEGIRCSEGTPVLDGNTVTGCERVAIEVRSSSPTIRYNLLHGNGKAILLDGSSAGKVLNNVIRHNKGPDVGGIEVWGGAPVIKNNVLYANVSPSEGSNLSVGGIGCSDTRAVIANNTLVGNSGGGAGALLIGAGAPTVANNLIAFNSSGIYGEATQAKFRYNLFYGNAGDAIMGVPAGTGDRHADPKLANFRAGDLHLQPDSPCRDAGDNTVVSSGDLDMDRAARIQGTKVDIGADESNGATWPGPPLAVFVSPSGNDARDGSSWSAAKRTVQAGIEAAALSGAEVWVAAGIYDENLTLPSFIPLLGGFAGTESARDARDPAANATILDAGGRGSVVHAPPGTVAALVDGFTIRNAGSSAGGTHVGVGVDAPEQADITVSNNLVRDNPIAGIWCSAASVVANNRVEDNGGGIRARGSYYGWKDTGILWQGRLAVRDNTVRRCGEGIGFSGAVTFTGNTIEDNRVGGILQNYGGLDAVITHNRIVGNGGSGIAANGTMEIRNNVVMANGSSGIEVGGVKVPIMNNTVAGNGGAGIATVPTDGVLYNVDARNNIVAFNRTGVSVDNSSVLRNNCVYGSVFADYTDADRTGADGNISVNPRLGGVWRANAHLRAGSPCIDAGDVTAVPAGGTDIDGQPRIQSAGVDIGADEFDGTMPGPLSVDIKVSPSGSDANDGATWETAKQTVGAALATAQAAGGADIWVAEGVYRERLTVGPRTRLYGGFRGDETDLSQRNPSAWSSALDGGGMGTVVTVDGGNVYTLVDGFTIRNGSGTMVTANEQTFLRGGGVRCSAGFAVIRNNLITGNSAEIGAGLDVASALPTGEGPVVRDNVIVANAASVRGGGLSIYSEATVTGNLIEGNTAGAAGAGGGVSIGRANARVERNTIRSNTARLGGGLYNEGVPNTYGAMFGTHLTNNVIAGNLASVAGGALYTLRNIIIGNNTIVENIAPDGGALHTIASYTNPTLTNNIVAFNSSGVSGAPVTFVTNNLFANAAYTVKDIPGPDPAQGNISADPLFMDREHGDYRLQPGSPCVDAGTGNIVIHGALDRDSRPRMVGAKVDIGAYELSAGMALPDAARALRVAAGLSAGTLADAARLDAEAGGTSTDRLDLADAIRLARKAVGLDPNP